jgi:predicted nucleic acid-binding protein
MATSAKRRTSVLVDTSVSVALVVADHEAHEATTRELQNERLGLSGHAWFETYSVLTRLPPPSRRAPADIQRIIEVGFPASVFLSDDAARALTNELSLHGIAGGSVYDALVGAAAREHRMPLMTRDRRALSVYGALAVDVVLMD